LDPNFFPLAGYWWLYLAFTALITLLLAVDLFLHRRENVISFPQAALWTGVWVGVALAFCFGLYQFAAARFAPAVARRLSSEFLAGYIIEESLSVDNMFVFALIFRYFAVPAHLQHRVLFYGVLGAIVFRGLFVAAGAALIRLHWVMVLFGAFLMYTGVRLALEREKQIDPSRNRVVRLARHFLPVTAQLQGSRFFALVKGVRHMTPLMVVLLCLETTDVVFAIDSVPAVFGVTREPLIVFTSNVFAILGLRSLYFLLAGAMDRFHAVKYGLAGVLVFVGLKMAWLDDLWGSRFPIAVSLVIISVMLASAVSVSLVFPVGRPLPDATTVARRLTGAICLGLAGLSVAAALGPGREWALLEHLATVGVEWLWISAVCYLLCGWALLRERISPSS
jgi:tellurite resistance protein TerC